MERGKRWEEWKQEWLDKAERFISRITFQTGGANNG